MKEGNKYPNNTGSLLSLGGIFVIIVAVSWWVYIYINGFEVKVAEAIVCLVSSSGECAIVNGLVELSGHTPYSPIVFWVGVAFVAVGFVINAKNKIQ